MNSKKWIYRIGALILLLALAGTMVVIGRGHTVYMDNKVLEYEGETYDCPRKITVYVDGERVAKLSKKDRGMATCIGQNFSMTLEVEQDKGSEPVTTEFDIKLPFNLDGIVINLPGLLAGLPDEAIMSEFVQLTAAEEPEEEIITDEFAMDSEF